MKRFKFFLLLFVLIPSLSQGQAGVDTLSLKSIFYEPLLAGNRPDFSTFSPNMRRVYYQSNDSAYIEEEHYSVSLKGNDKQKADDQFKADFALAPNNRRVVYAQDGDLWIANPDFSNKTRLVKSKTSEYDPTWGPQSRRIAYVQDGDVWIINIQTSMLTQVTGKESDEPGYSIVDWAGDNKLVLSQWDTSDYKEYYFPEYVDQYVETGATRRGVATRLLSVAYLDSNKTEKLHQQKGYLSTSISADGQYLAVDQRDAPMKQRSILVFNLEEHDSTTVFEDSTEGWIYGTDLAFAPEGNKLMFQSEQDGWNHIYTVNPDGSELQQHTKGNFEVPWAAWTGKDHIVFASTEVDPGERHVYTLDISDDNIEKLTSKTGYRQDFQLSRNHRHLVYNYTYFNQPSELHALDLRNPKKETRLTHTIPDRFNAIDWQQEDYIRFTGRDGDTQLSMSVLEPLNKQAGKKYPVVVFVHGAGSLQNVYKGWSNNYHREYMFHQYLTARGYYVIEVDYRHSTGYGRKFREDVTNWMGKYETQDIVDGINYLAGHYAQADTSQVGIYGGSYGGFMSLYATSVAPDYFDAAAALRSVTNWDNYYYTNPWYTLPRLGKPETDSTNYARSSPITYVDQLKKPVLLLHGLEDNNVGFQDVAQYIHELIEAGNKDFDMMMYPDERHSFEDPDAWYDEYSRIFDFFEEHLQSR
ncbi:alpha/beta hydrolase family protein [Fodinibius salsisoli]|uniref:S9 family peptidase n=1 Tax=Fodinibius salsisoli TaxID=2820877 RepID=A0ABT3PHT0_9BACT|nr:S9 family peptidase [Fodinibius salsisoli]MCW9705484.1 S9 family peptidase [Fodinibius salsisoli]